MKQILARLVALNDRFAHVAARVSSWSLWLTLITFGTAVWLIAQWLSHGRLDPGLSVWVAILTIQTSIDAAAQRLNQISLRQADEKREVHQAQQMDAITDLTLAMRDELDRAKDRDMASAQRDEILRQLLTQLIQTVTEEPQ